MTEEDRKLVEFFNSEDGHAFGVQGDHFGWSPAETAIHFLKILAADSDVKFLARTVDEHRITVNRQLDSIQRRFNDVFEVKR